MPATAFEREVLTTLGELVSGQRRLDEDAADARESRRRLYQKQEETSDAITHLQNDVKIAAQVAAQARDKVELEVMPAVRTITNLKLQGATVLTGAAFVGAMISAVIGANAGAIWMWIKGAF